MVECGGFRLRLVDDDCLGADHRALEGFKVENPSKMMCNIFTLLVLYWCIKDREEGILCK